MSIVLDGTTGVTAPALTGPIDAANLTGVLPAIDGSALTGLTSTNPLTLGTAVASTSGTAIDLTGIPSWAKRVTLMFDGVSFASNPLRVVVNLGTSAGFETTGYVSSAMTSYTNSIATWTSSDGIHLGGLSSYSDTTYYNGQIVFSNLTGNTWIAHGATALTGDFQLDVCSGTKTLSGTLNSIRIRNYFAATFDAGTINISYEG